MGICIFGQKAEFVLVNGHRVKLVDVDKKTKQLEIIGQGGKRWVSYDQATFNGQSFKNCDIRLPKPSGTESKKRAKLRSAMQQLSDQSVVA